jgi:AcrR family transcriptional regulator
MHVRMSSGMSPEQAPERPQTQKERSERSRSALLESAARHLSRHGYGNLVLERVARDAGYSRGAIYHQFADKEDLTLAVLEWVWQTWGEEVGSVVERQPDHASGLIALARAHAVFCRRDIARFAMALRLEFADPTHPIGEAVDGVTGALVERCGRMIAAGRRDGSIPPGPPAKTTALAFVGAIEGAVIELSGKEPHDAELAARAAAGVLGLDPTHTSA